MATQNIAELKNRYQFIHRVMSGLIVICVSLAIIAGLSSGVSAETNTWAELEWFFYTICYTLGLNTTIGRAVLVFLCIAIIERCLLRLWSSWEEVSVVTTKKPTVRK